MALQRGSTVQVLYSSNEENSEWIPTFQKFASGPVMASLNDERIVDVAVAMIGFDCSFAQ